MLHGCSTDNSTQVVARQYSRSLNFQYVGINFDGMTYGERLKKARLLRKLSQPKLAELSGVKQGSISKIERGDQDASAFDIPLAYALKISPFWLNMGKGDMEIGSLALTALEKQVLEELSGFDNEDIMDLLDEIESIKRRRDRRKGIINPLKVSSVLETVAVKKR